MFGAGIVNNSGITQNFVLLGGADGVGIAFENNVTAGTSTVFTVNGSPNAGEHSRGSIAFSGNSTAGNGTFTLNGGTADNADGGWVFLTNNATAGNGIFVNNGGAVDFARGGHTDFQLNSTAGNGTLIANGGDAPGSFGGIIAFDNGSYATAGAATLIANGGAGGNQGGSILFYGATTGGTSRVEVFGNGNLDISSHMVNFQYLTITVGSIEGSCAVFLGGGSLSAGSNNVSTTFSGSIQDCGINCLGGGSLTKIGTGTLTLSGANTYTGVTTVSAGTLLVNTKPSSGTFTLKSTLTFSSDATYNFSLRTSTSTADEVVAHGVTINSGAQFTFAGVGATVLSTGTVFTVISNTAATAIAGRFGNLPDGSTFTSNGNTYKVNYEGGDGNDLTLTVVP